MQTPGMEVVLRSPPIKLKYQLKAVDYAGHSPEERLLVKAEILRRTLLLEWLTISEIRSMALPDSLLLNFMLDAHLKNVTFGKATLAQMAFPLAPGTLSQEFSSFPNWSLLLPELQVKILNWLTSPTDQLNMLEAFPKAAPLMGQQWKSASALRFEATFPESGLSWDNWRSMQMFRITGPEIRSVINEQFSKYLSTGDYEEENATGHFNDLIRSNGNIRWSNLDPITCQVLLTFGEEDPEDQNANDMHRVFENWIGPRTWRCCFYHNNYMDWPFSPVQFTQRMGQCLEKMRNLRKMVINLFMENWNTSWAEIEFLALPDLQYLHSIVFELDNNGPEETLIRRKLMQRYAAQLNCLEFTFNYSVCSFPPTIPNRFPAHFQHQPDFPEFPQLTIWKFTCPTAPGWGWDLHCDLLQKLVGSPLKVAHFTVNVSTGETGFSDFLSVLGNGFGGTLEELDIIAKVPAGQQIQASWKRQSGDKLKDNLVNVAFLKLKHLKINVDPCPEGWDFLLLFPSLEKFTFSFSSEDQVENRQVDREDSIVELSSDLEAMRQSNVWKLFPNLMEIVKDEEVLEFGLHEARSETITRQEILTAAAAD